MKNKAKQAAALLLAALLCLQCAAPALAAEDGGTIYISSAAGLLALAKNSTLDTWSQGKTVVLTQDISLSGVEYAPIPTFGGVFDGGGHTISGLELTGSYSPAGLFGILQPGAVVKNLHVSGTVAPSGKGGETGGIAGRSGGLIENCSFSGVIDGDSGVGGVAGVNEPRGEVRGCTASGTVTGKSMTGGVVGKNLGVISSSENQSQVNTESVDPGLDLEDLDLSLSGDLFTLRSMETVNVATDTGGIAGYSTGLVLGCSNSGTVGYPHIGYNVGGIVGRSCGHVANCVNRGAVMGRKDVGGVAGQAEPDIILTLTPDSLQQMQAELDRLNALVNQTVDSAERASSDVSAKLDGIGGSVGAASGHTRELLRLIADYGDGALTEIDRGSAILSNALDRMAEISQDMPALSDGMTQGITKLEAAVRELAKVDSLSAPVQQELNAAAAELSAAGRLVSSGTTKLTEGLEALAGSVKVEDQEAMDEALETVQAGLGELNAAMELVSAALQKLADSFSEEDDTVDWAQASEALGELGGAFGEVSAALDTVSQGVTAIRENLSLDSEQAQAGLAKLRDGASDLDKAMDRLQAAAGHGQNALAQMGGISAQLKRALDAMADALGTFGGVSDQGTGIFIQIRELLDYLASVDPIQIAHPSEEIGNSANALFDALEQMQGQMDALNELGNTTAGTLAGNIRAISSQMGRVTSALTDAVYQTENPSVGDSFSDTSQVDVDAVTTGKLLSCVNEGDVSGDISVGGIAGAMAVEYELDPEDDLTSDAPARRREYELKVILQDCVNTGTVVSRRNYAGSVCGQMELGLITSCQGYGTAESQNGGYVGGITGIAAGTVRDSWAKCALSGGDHVGGIAGAAKDDGSILRCRSLVDIPSCKQYAGAIVGGEGGSLTDNLFVSTELAGISMVSVAGQAEPAPYEDLVAAEHTPEAFRRFTLRFWADGQLVKEIPFQYGDSFEEDIFPAIPTQEGHFARWDRSDLDDLRFDTDVTAIYSQFISALESEEKREDGRPVFLTEGLFSEGDALSASRQEQNGTPLPQTAGTVLEHWRLDIPEDGQEARSVRYLPPDGAGKNLAVYAKDIGGWRALDAEMFGSYLMFEANGPAFEVVIVESPVLLWTWIGLGAATIFVIGLIVWMIKRHHSKESF